MIPVVVAPRSPLTAAGSKAVLPKSPVALPGSPSQVEPAGKLRDSERPECMGPTSDPAVAASRSAESAGARCETSTATLPRKEDLPRKQDLPRKHDLKTPPLRWIVSALRNLGWSATDARERVLRAVELFESRGVNPREEELLKSALSLRC